LAKADARDIQESSMADDDKEFALILVLDVLA